MSDPDGDLCALADHQLMPVAINILTGGQRMGYVQSPLKLLTCHGILLHLRQCPPQGRDGR